MQAVNDCGHLIYREYPDEAARTLTNAVTERHGGREA